MDENYMNVPSKKDKYYASANKQQTGKKNIWIVAVFPQSRDRALNGNKGWIGN